MLSYLRLLGERAFTLAARVRARPSARQAGLLFVFDGGSRARVEMGRELYATRRAFRESIEAAAAVVESVIDYPVAAAFGGRGMAGRAGITIERTRRDDLVRMGLWQMAMVDLWREEGIVPDAVCAISLGETVAPYAAGMLSRADCARVVAVIAEATSRTRAPSVLFVLNCDETSAQEICEDAPASLTFLGASSPRSAFVLGSVDDAPVLRPYLAQYPVRGELPSHWNYHTPGLDVDRAWMRTQLATIVVHPARCPVYSSISGGRLPDVQRLDADYFAWIASRPFYFARAVEAALADGFQTVLSIGVERGKSVEIAAVASASGKQVCILHSLPNEGEERAWWRISSEIRPNAARRALAPNAGASLLQDVHSALLGQASSEAYQRLRPGDAVYQIEPSGTWALLSYEKVRYALTHPKQFSSDHPQHRNIDEVLLGADAPRHTAARRRLSRRFSTAAIKQYLAEVNRAAVEYLQPLFDGKELDIVSGFTRPLADLVGALVLGLAPSDVRSLERPTRRACAAGVSLFAALREPLYALASQSTLLAELMLPVEDVAYTQQEAHSLIRLLWVAGTDTLSRFLPSAVLLLLEHDELRKQLLADPQLTTAFVDEALRLRPPESAVVRRTTMDVDLGERTIPAHSVVRLGLAAANLDPARFEDPFSMRLDRPEAAYLSFGGGPHHCLGVALARSIAVAAVSALLQGAPDFRMLQPLPIFRPARGRPLRCIEQLIICR